MKSTNTSNPKVRSPWPTHNWIPPLALLVAVASLIVAATSLVLQWAASPFFEARASDLTYWYFEKNVLGVGEEIRQGKLDITLTNDSWKPAYDVKVVIKSLSQSPTVKCSAKHDIQDSPEGKKLISVRKIPAGQTVTIEIIEPVENFELIVENS